MASNDKVEGFTSSLKAGTEDYSLKLTEQTIQQLAEYYSLLTRWNERLHLVAPCSPEEFAQRHILESLMLLRFFPVNASVVDVGSGAGLPIIPCLIARSDLTATLIESSQKKSVFLREALSQIGLAKRATIVAKPFEQVQAPAVMFVTCRALDEFMSKVSALVNWAPRQSTLLLFGGEALRKQLDTLEVRYTEFLIPLSEKRFLFEVTQATTR
jgi:16S rRNA (guanine527-N7)-methyltransferase